REEYEKRQNQEIVRKNIAEIVDNCVNTVNTGCSIEVEEVLNEVCECLEQLDLSSIDSNDPIASGILDVAEGVDGVADKLTVGTKEILNEVELTEPEFSEKTDAMLDEFINGYNLLGPDFDPALANPITFPRNENNLNTRRTLLTTFDLLEGLRNCWSLRPLLGESEYSENSYVIHTVSRAMDPIFNYYKWSLKRSWEKVADSSQTRKEAMRSVQSGDRPDLQVLLMLDSAKMRLMRDLKKINRLCKDAIDARFEKLFKGRDTECDDARRLIDELLQIPFIGIQVIRNRVLVFGIDFCNNSFYRSFKICEYTIPLRVSGRQIVKKFINAEVGNSATGSNMSISTTY
ncbi:6759_t:CDS:2, partial [Ambispora gerdemannii]